MHWVFQQSLSPDGAPTSPSTTSSSYTDYTQPYQSDSSSSSGESRPFKTSYTDHPSPALSSSCSSSSTVGGSFALQGNSNSRLFHLLIACAEAGEEKNFNLAEAMVKEIRSLANSQAGVICKIAMLFAEALDYKICGIGHQFNQPYSILLEKEFCEFPFVRFAHFTANQAILEAFAGKTRVHIIDFSINQGLQWPALMQAFALRSGGPPIFRLTGIGPPVSDGSEYHKRIGWNLGQLAETIGVQFEYRGFTAESLDDLDAIMLQVNPIEFGSVAVNSIFELHKLLGRPGAIDKVLSMVKQMKPEIFTIAEQEADTNNPIFLDRFTKSLHYYLAMYESLEVSAITQDKLESEIYLGMQIFNTVACEGFNRIERYEKLARWRTRLGSAGFVPIDLGSNGLKQAGLLLSLIAGNEGYTLEEDNGCLMLGCHTVPLIATSAWRPGN
ncbi:hypothetical protein P3X46_024473 [Hevea brasiliensis]|uniref:DELLA protein n=1 Tax=Hevea brasiliensis TaxID=3981 RepID=A0ABQ9L4B2_HEVBR|nr:DELLA protein GAIP [Hevea brasiliensis]KAJ9158930.1 hypothetical protein P3X46_024473 [Hevea brasiliensis]